MSAELLAAISVGFAVAFVALVVIGIRRAERLDPYDPRGYSNSELRRAERARADVEQRRAEQERAVAALDAMGDDLADVIPLPEREPAEIVPFPTIRRGGGFQR